MCKNCGREIPNQAKFCEECGCAVDQIEEQQEKQPETSMDEKNQEEQAEMPEEGSAQQEEEQQPQEENGRQEEKAEAPAKENNQPERKPEDKIQEDSQLRTEREAQKEFISIEESEYAPKEVKVAGASNRKAILLIVLSLVLLLVAWFVYKGVASEKEDASAEFSQEEQQEEEVLGQPFQIPEQLVEQKNESNPPQAPNQTQQEKAPTSNEILNELGVSAEEFKQGCHDLSSDGLVLDDMMMNPNSYVNRGYYDYITISEKGMSADGYPCYVINEGWTVWGRIYDLREDVYAPTISQGNTYNLTMQFKGIQTDDYGNDYLVFWLISVEPGEYNPPNMPMPPKLASDILSGSGVSEEEYREMCLQLRAGEVPQFETFPSFIPGVADGLWERVFHPEEYLGECYRFEFIASPGSFEKNGYRYYLEEIESICIDDVYTSTKIPVIIIDYRNQKYPANRKEKKSMIVDGYMTFSGVTSYTKFGIAYHNAGGDNQEYYTYNGETYDTHEDDIVLVFDLLSGDERPFM